MRALIRATLLCAAAPAAAGELTCASLPGMTFTGANAPEETLSFAEKSVATWSRARTGSYKCENGTIRMDFVVDSTTVIDDTAVLDAKGFTTKTLGRFLPKDAERARALTCEGLAGATWEVDETMAPGLTRKPLSGGFQSDLEDEATRPEAKPEPKGTLTFAKGGVSFRPIAGPPSSMSYRCENAGVRVQRVGTWHLLPWTEEGLLWFSKKARPAPKEAAP